MTTPKEYVKELCINMPTTFAAAEFTTFMARVRSVLLNPKGIEWPEFAGASNLMAWRFRDVVECFDAFSDSWHEFGDANADHEEFYKRDCALFGMFSAGVSCIEATGYGLYALASHPKILGLPFGPKERKAAYPAQVRDALRSASPQSSVVATLDAMLTAAEWATWVEFRNRMSHRSNLPRIINMVIGEGTLPPPQPMNVAATSSTQAFAGDLTDIQQLIEWLASTQRSLFVAATALIPT